MKVLTKLAATMVVFFCVAFVGAAESNPSAKEVLGVAEVVVKEALTRKHAQKDNPHCDEITERGLFLTQWSGRNCAGGVYRRGDTVMLVTSTDRNSDPDRFASKLLPVSTEPYDVKYNFNRRHNSAVAVYYEVDGNRLHIGAGGDEKEASNLARQSCRKSKCRKLLVGFNTWKPSSLANPDHETIQFINVDGTGYSTCGDQIGRNCKKR